MLENVHALQWLLGISCLANVFWIMAFGASILRDRFADAMSVPGSGIRRS